MPISFAGVRISPYFSAAIEGTTTTTPLDVRSMGQISFQLTSVVPGSAATVANDTGVSIANDTLTSGTAHGFFKGEKIRLTSTGTLPTGLATATDYYVLPITTTIFALFDTLAHALAASITGTNLSTSTGIVDITALGTAASTITATPVSLTGLTWKVQQSNDYVPETGVGNWVDLSGVSGTTSTSTSVMGVITTNSSTYARLSFGVTTGSAVYTIAVNERT